MNVVEGTEERQDDWQKNEPITHSKNDNAEPHFEEHFEYVRLAS